MNNHYDIIREPIISEKSMADAGKKRYTFKVDPKANKNEIKDAVEKVFDVSVKKVNTMNYQGKLKRMGKNIGRRSSFKKAIVTLAKDSKTIEVFEGL